MRIAGIPVRGAQAGSALVVTLILLTVLTVVGVAGMGVSILQQRMAGNLRDGIQVFEATESALRLCEKYVLAGRSDATGRSDTAELAEFAMGTAVAPVQAELFRPAPAEPLAAKGATDYRLRCLIEFTGPADVSRTGDSVRRPGVGGGRTGYRITAAGARVRKGRIGPVRPTVILQSDVLTRD